MNYMIRKDCFWYRPWKDMSATIDSCYYGGDYICDCCEDCELYISKRQADKIMNWLIHSGIKEVMEDI